MHTLRMLFAHGEPAGPLRRGVDDLLRPGCSREQIEDVLVVVSELVQNVTQHTAGGGELVLHAKSNRVVIEVHDGDLALPRPQAPDDRRPGGRGLLLVAGLTSNWGAVTTPKGKMVWAEVALSRAAVAV